MRIRSVRVHRDIFAAYADLYLAATIMTQKMDEVLDHKEHKALIKSGLENGYRMPDVDAVRARNSIIKIYLDGIDLHANAVEKDGIVEFPARTARQLHLVAKHSNLMINDIINNINGSEYMLWLRDLKKMGGAYMGPTSLQEVFNVLGTLYVSQKRESKLASGRGLPANWLKLVV